MTNSSASEARHPIQLSPERLPRLLAWIVLALLLAHIAFQTFHYRVHELPWLLTDLFDVDEEESFSTWFSATMLLICSILLLAIAHRASDGAGRFARHWYGLAIGFALLFMDEVIGLHETLNTATDFPWTILAAALLAAVAPFYLRFLPNLPSRTRWLFVAAGTAFVGGSVGVEHATDYYIEAFDMDNLGYQFLTALEEGLEMMGVVVFVHALLAYLTLHARSVVPVLGIGAPEHLSAPSREAHVPSDAGPAAGGLPSPGYPEGPYSFALA